MAERNTLDMVRARVGPRVVGVGLAMVAIAYLGYSSADHTPQASAPPRPAVTVTATPPPAKPTPRGSAALAPHLKPRQTSGSGRVAAADAKAGMGGRQHPGGTRPSGSMPRPTPPAQQPAGTSCGIAVTVLTLNACLQLGGNR